MRIGITSEDDKFLLLYRYFHCLTDAEVTFFTHRDAIPKHDAILLALIQEWKERFDAIFVPLSFSYFGSLRIAELVRLHRISLGVILYSASAELDEKLAVPLFGSYLDSRIIEPQLLKFVSMRGCEAPRSAEGVAELTKVIDDAIDSATNIELKLMIQSELEMLISALLSTQGCFAYEPYSGRHPELRIRASIVDYKARIYLEDQIKQFPRGARQSEVDRWRQSQLTIIGNVRMSQDNINISNVTGSVNVKSRLKRVSQVVKVASALNDKQKTQLNTLLGKLRTAIDPIAESRTEDAQRVVHAAEMMVVELNKATPNKSFLTITTKGLKEAAKAVADIAPTVLTVAGQIAKFVSGVV